MKSFASQKFQIAILDISETSGEAVLSSLRQDFPAARFVFHKCDVSLWDDQKAAFEKIFQEFEHIDIIIANAGISEKGNFLAIDPREPVKPTFATLEVNMTGMLYSKPTSIVLSTADRYSRQAGRSLSTQERSSAERLYNLHRVERRSLSFSYSPDVRHVQTRHGRGRKISGQASARRRDPDQRPRAFCHWYRGVDPQIETEADRAQRRILPTAIFSRR